MWDEQYHPRTVSDLTWSRAKLRELSAWRLFDPEAQVAVEPRRVTMAHVSRSMRAPLCFTRPVLLMHGPSGCGKLSVLRVVYRRSICQSDDEASSLVPNASVFFASEHTLSELEEFLSGVVRSDVTQQGTTALCVVKELPTTFESGRPGNPVFDVLRRFIRAVEGRTLRGEHPTPVIFLHTSHDVHSSKVDLFRTFPQDLIDSRCTQMFHCTPATDLNLANRLQWVAERALPPHVVSRMSRDEIQCIASAARGDIRQALLQLRWAALIPSSTPRSVTAAFARPLKRGRREEESAGERDLALIERNGECLSNPGPSSAASEENASSSYSRDEYIDVAHGAARILSQKYSVRSVMSLLTVAPDRLVSYIAANLHRYFSGDSMASLAAVTASCSSFDVASAVARDPRANGLLGSGLGPDDVALTVLGAQYRNLTGVVAPQDFSGLGPLPPVQPQLVHLCPTRNCVADLDNDTEVGPSRYRNDRSGWRTPSELAAARLRSELLLFSPTASSSADAVMTDLLPMLPRILLSSTVTPLNAPLTTTNARSVAQPKRTMFTQPKQVARNDTHLIVSDVVVALAREASFGRYRDWHLRSDVKVKQWNDTSPLSGDATDPITEFSD